MKVFKQCCNNCLLSKDRIVSPQRAKQIVKDCIENQTHFICHKATMNGAQNIVCKKYFDTLGQNSQLIRIAQRLNMIQMVEQTDAEKLPTYKEMSSKQATLES